MRYRRLRARFQYPLADRRACGDDRTIMDDPTISFSILLRIVELAALRCLDALRARQCFSILLRIVELAGSVLPRCTPVSTFQYPLADRRACGYVHTVYVSTSLVSVSSCGS